MKKNTRASIGVQCGLIALLTLSSLALFAQDLFA